MLLALPLLLFAQAQPAATAKQKQIDSLIAQIRRLAVSEPAVYGVDTRLRLGQALSVRYPKLALESYRDAADSLTGVPDPDDQERLRVRTVELLGRLDIGEGEQLIRSVRREHDHDYVAQAYDRLYLLLENRPADARRMVSKGLAAGAFRMVSAARLLESAASGGDANGAVRIYTEILAAFPGESPDAEDLSYLLHQTVLIAPLNRQVALEGALKALRAVPSLSKDAQRRIFPAVSKLLADLDPELLERYRTEHAELTDLEPAEEPKKKETTDTPDLSNLPYPAALDAARAMPDPADRFISLLLISRRETVSSQQRASVATEALTAAAKMSVPEDRLLALAMVSRDFARNGELASAGLAAQVLLENYNKVCDCPTSTCGKDEKKVDCVDDVQQFAEYLDEFKVAPESMSLNNISLESRLLILKLRTLLGVK